MKHNINAYSQMSDIKIKEISHKLYAFTHRITTKLILIATKCKIQGLPMNIGFFFLTVSACHCCWLTFSGSVA